MRPLLRGNGSARSTPADFLEGKPKGQTNSAFWFPLKSYLKVHPSLRTEITGTSTLGSAVMPLKSVKAGELSMAWSKNYQKEVC